MKIAEARASGSVMASLNLWPGRPANDGPTGYPQDRHRSGANPITHGDVMKFFTVILARLVREEVTVIAEAESREALESNLHEVYEAAEGNRFYDSYWRPDCQWGSEEGTHAVVDEIEVESTPGKIGTLNACRTDDGIQPCIKVASKREWKHPLP